MRRNLLLYALLVLGGVAISGCIATRGSSIGARDASLITRSEIIRADVATALDAIVKLRPAFLRYRGNATTSSPAGVAPVVYFGDDRLGGVDLLSTIDIIHVQEIRYISAIDATTRWGTGHTGGVIQVITRKVQ